MNIDKIQDLVCRYSFDDIAKSFFVISLWIPNISSTIKSQYLYILLESVFDKLKQENQIHCYNDFKLFSDELIPLIPTFPMMEDFLPEQDWGEIKYFYNDKFFEIFYGSDLSNPYDYFYSFEIVHCSFEDFYIEKLGRSPSREFEFCMKIQDHIINGIDKSSQQYSEMNPGDFLTPSELFWNDTTKFLNNFDPEGLYDQNLLKEYTKDFDKCSPTKLTDNETFLNQTYENKNCACFFIRKGSNSYPVLPRRYFSILMDKWDEIQQRSLLEIRKTVKNYETKIGLELYRFIRYRLSGEVYCLTCALEPDFHPHEILFDVAFRSKDRLILFHVLSPTSSNDEPQLALISLESSLKTAYELVSKHPITIGLHSQEKIVQLESDNSTSLKPYILTVIPRISTEISCIEIPNNFIGEVINLDQLLGIIDELENVDELSDFLDYKEALQISTLMNPLTSWLDIFGSFKDSNGILLTGAIKYNYLDLGSQWGTHFRFNSLCEFWKKFPKVNLFGHPRSWSISNDAFINTVITLKSKQFSGYSYYIQVGSAHIFTNSPFKDLSYEEGSLVDLLMGMILDSLNNNISDITDLQFTKSMKKFHILLFPETLVETNKEFNYLTHLIPKLENWDMDFTVLGNDEYGIRIVFNHGRMVSVLNGAKDRSSQIELLIDLLMLLENFFKSDKFFLIQGKLINEKTKTNRYRLFSKKKEVSFPELTHFVKPGDREDKLAQKKLAEIAFNRNLLLGMYSGDEAKETINFLRDGLVSHINESVQRFDFKKAIPLLIGNLDSLCCNFDRKTDQAKNSLDQEVDYQRDVLASNDEQTFILYRNIYRYLIEKFVQLQPEGDAIFGENELKELLSLIDKVINLYGTSDLLHYEIYPVAIRIESDFQFFREYGLEFEKKQDEFSRYRASLNLGLIGNKEDTISLFIDMNSFMEELDLAFKQDLGFGLSHLVNLQQVLSQWTFYKRGIPEAIFYHDSLNEITSVCLIAIKGIDPTNIKLITDFLTLDPVKILSIQSDDKQASDLPVWEYIKRANRYSIKPLIKVENDYYWGAYSLYHSMQNWRNSILNYRLPAEIDAPSINKVLEKGHKAMEDSLQAKIEEIVSRFTSNVKTGLYPSKLGLSSIDIGDIDVFAFIQEKNILLNIESKIIDQAYCLKDLKRIAKRIFGKKAESGEYENGYLQSVERRESFLISKSEEMIEICWKKQAIKPKIVSVFVSKTSYWWTFNPPIITNVHFVELRLLDDFIKGLLYEE